MSKTENTERSMMTVDSVPERRVKRPGGIEIAYWVHGEGQPLTLIMGLGTPAASWGPLPALLSQQGYKVIVVENRDCGRSSPCEGLTYTIRDMADDVVAVLDATGVDKSYVLGISMGGMIAQELVLNNPERVSRLMLMATTPGGAAGVSASPAFLAELFTAPPSEDERADWIIRTLGMITGPGFVDEHPETIELSGSIRLEQGSDPAEFARQWQAIMTFATWDRLPGINVPTMVVHGDADPLVPYPNGVNIAERIPEAELVTLPGVGHLVPLEAPAETFQAIARFFPIEAPVSG